MDIGDYKLPTVGYSARQPEKTGLPVGMRAPCRPTVRQFSLMVGSCIQVAVCNEFAVRIRTPERLSFPVRLMGPPASGATLGPKLVILLGDCETFAFAEHNQFVLDQRVGPMR